MPLAATSQDEKLLEREDKFEDTIINGVILGWMVSLCSEEVS
jgi:hypothetical protein